MVLLAAQLSQAERYLLWNLHSKIDVSNYHFDGVKVSHPLACLKQGH